MIYPYICENCKHEIELMMTVKRYEEFSKEDKPCIACGKINTLKRVIGHIPIKFNGEGYTKTFIK